ncbi:MAG: hypothetical protein Q4F34_03140, partial [Prevotellaceae bacterium]|nr:hypothetical protein [Prevotellaceae bacterium]
YDFIAYFDACYDVFGTKSKSPNATLFTDIDLTQANKIDSKWFATTFLKEDTTSSWHDATFDGNGHTIKGLFPTAFPDSTQRGLFGYIDKGRVKNLTIDGIAWDSDNSALLCGKASNSTFENITIKGYVKSRHGRAAGLCDEAYNCKFLRCHNFANIESPDNSIGGIVAIAEGGSIRECTNQANIDGRQSKYVGGLVGNYTGEFLIENSGNYGNVIGKDCVGGIVGAFAIPETYFYTQQSQRSSNLYNSLNVGDITITGESYDKGGLAGFCALPDSLVSINETELDAFMDMQIQNSYYKGSQLMIGSAENTTSERKNIKCTDAQLTSGEICYNLNNKKNDTDVIWHQDLGNQIYPYPYGDKLLPPSVNVNDGAIFVAANSTIDSLTIHPDTYGEDSYFHTDVSFTVKEMKYIRKATVKKNFYATLYLPFAFSDERLKILDFDYYDNETGTVYFKDVEGMTVPNHPYIVRMADSYDKDSVIQLVISAENALVVPDTSTIDIEKQIDCIPTGFYGTYAFRRIYGNNGFYAYSSANGDFRKANSVDGNPVYPFRCVFKVGPDATAPATIDFVAPEDGGVTNISSSKIVEIDTNTSIYNLNGQAVGNSFNSLKPGIYIYKGKKIYIK